MDIDICIQIPEPPCFIKLYEALKGEEFYFCGSYAVFIGAWMSFLESVFLIKVLKAKDMYFSFMPLLEGKKEIACRKNQASF